MWSGCQVFSGERAAVLLTLMLTCVRGKNAAAQACLNVGPTVNSPVGLNDSTWHKNENAIECWKPWSNGQAIQLAWAVLFLRLGWEENGQVERTEVRWANTSSKALRGEERDEKRVEESQEDVHRNENRWKEMTRGEKSLEELRCGFTICNKRSEFPEKSMEVCRSSYRQTLFLDTIALHFLNLETSANRLARVLLIYI